MPEECPDTSDPLDSDIFAWATVYRFVLWKINIKQYAILSKKQIYQNNGTEKLNYYT